MRFLYFLIPFCFSFQAISQSVQWEELANVPERVSNNAVTTAEVGGTPYVYSFSGIDSTKDCDGDHLRSFRYNTSTDIWELIPDLPDNLGGKIAAGASTVKNKIYIIGGYHLASNCGETSSQKIHVFNPETNAYEADGAPLLRAIDDQIQAVWRDSLIYVISGWSNTLNVVNVQIYNPEEDEWNAGTFVPNSSNWRVFGASGTIIEDTIYIAGGAGNWNGSNFPATQFFRKGIINPEIPTEITWEGASETMARGYRMGVSDFEGKALWIGGSEETYNFDGIAYNGSGGVAALDRITIYDPSLGQLDQLFGYIPPIMDLRGVAKISSTEFIIAGGMVTNQEVTNKTFKITIDALTATEEVVFTNTQFFPNPVRDHLYYKGEKTVWIELYNSKGQLLETRRVETGASFDLGLYPDGVYFLNYELEGEGRRRVEKLLKIN